MQISWRFKIQVNSGDVAVANGTGGKSGLLVAQVLKKAQLLW
ncbi:hypothetical protein ACVNPX_09195 [Staphylococcus aureus]